MATLSSILAWRILWTEEPGGLQSMGSQESDMTAFVVELMGSWVTRGIVKYPKNFKMQSLNWQGTS